MDCFHFIELKKPGVTPALVISFEYSVALFVIATKYSYFCKKVEIWVQKINDRFCRLPKDFTYEETLKLLSAFGYSEHNKGATSGSRVRFKNEQTGQFIDIHKPHPGSIMKEWMMKTIFQHLKSKGCIK